MEQHQDRKISSDGAPPVASPAIWIAPLQSITAFSVAEFTSGGAAPGDDGSGTFTAS